MLTPYEKMMGSLVGFCKAITNEPFTDEDISLIVRSLSVRPEDDTMSKSVQTELRKRKFHYSPDCFTCTHPCGRTADADWRLLEQEPQELQEVKREMLSEMRLYISRLKTIRTADAKLFIDAISLIADEIDPDDYRFYTERIRNAIS